MSAESRNVVDELNRCLPAAKHAQLGSALQESIDAIQAQLTLLATAVGKVNALLAALDADTKTSGGYATGIGTMSTATIAITIQDLNDRA